MQQLHKQARAQLLICKENLKQKDEQLQPLREARDQQSKARDALRSGGDVKITSEEQLDERLQQMHHRQQHESLSANDEKLLLKEIKQLQVSRWTQPMQPFALGHVSSQRWQHCIILRQDLSPVQVATTDPQHAPSTIYSC